MKRAVKRVLTDNSSIASAILRRRGATLLCPTSNVVQPQMSANLGSCPPPECMLLASMSVAPLVGFPVSSERFR